MVPRNHSFVLAADMPSLVWLSMDVATFESKEMGGGGGGNGITFQFSTLSRE